MSEQQPPQFNKNFISGLEQQLREVGKTPGAAKQLRRSCKLFWPKGSLSGIDENIEIVFRAPSNRDFIKMSKQLDGAGESATVLLMATAAIEQVNGQELTPVQKEVFLDKLTLSDYGAVAMAWNLFESRKIDASKHYDVTSPDFLALTGTTPQS